MRKPISFPAILLPVVLSVVPCVWQPVWADNAVDVAPPSAKVQKMSEDELKQRGKQLYAALQERFESLKKFNDLPHANGSHQDVSDVVAKYIPIGMPFLDTEIILRAANAKLAETPPRAARSNDPYYDRFDILGGIMMYQSLGVEVEVGVSIKPTEPANPNTTVKKVEGSLAISAL